MYSGLHRLRSMRVLLPYILGLYAVATVFVAQVSFKQSTLVSGFWNFVLWQAIGNVVAFTGVLAETWLIKLTTLNIAFAVMGGLGFLAVQVLGAGVLFHERISWGQWIGTALIFVGIVLIALTRQAAPAQ